MNTLDWNQITLKEKKKLNIYRPIFIVGSREITTTKIKQLTHKLIHSTGKKILFGCLKDPYINGLEDSPQFKTLDLKTLQNTICDSSEKDCIDILNYFQRDTNYILEELKFSIVIFINGSWHGVIHRKKEYWILVNNKIKHKFISPFESEAEAIKYSDEKVKELEIQNSKMYTKNSKELTQEEIFNIVQNISKKSFDYTWQTGAVLTDKNNKILITGYNRILPYETFAMHYGSLREKNFSPPNDLNNYDTIHAEVDIMLQAIDKKMDLKDTKLYINLLPCPTCAKMIAKSKINTIIYQQDHSDGYAFKLLKNMGKNIERFV